MFALRVEHTRSVPQSQRNASDVKDTAKRRSIDQLKFTELDLPG